MNTIPISVAAALAATLLLIAAPAWAQANRTFVSGHGDDGNPCSLSAPCRSFAQALTQTNAGGEITVLDPAGYGRVTINKSVSIVNDGVGEAGVTVTPTSGANAITVTTGASDIVNLRGLTLVGNGDPTGNGIFFDNLGALNIQNCVIRGFTDDGINLSPAGSAQFNVSDTIVANVGLNGVEVGAAAGTVSAVFNRVQAVGSVLFAGFAIGGGGATSLNVTIADSAASNNATAGIATSGSVANTNTQVMVVNSVIANNHAGVTEFGANSTTYLARNTITGNTVAFSVDSGGTLNSFGDNDIKSNSNDGGAIPLVSTK